MTAPAPFLTGDLVTLVDELMTCLQASSAELSVTLPTRQVAGTGLIPVDCEQATVSLIQVGTGAVEAPGARGGSSSYPNPGANMTLYNLVLTVTISRKANEVPQAPLGQMAPTVAAYGQDLTTVSADLAVIAYAIDKFAEVRISPVQRTLTAGPPKGGYLTSQARITTDTV